MQYKIETGKRREGERDVQSLQHCFQIKMVTFCVGKTFIRQWKWSDMKTTGNHINLCPCPALGLIPPSHIVSGDK